jgi:hypothetical protein
MNVLRIAYRCVASLLLKVIREISPRRHNRMRGPHVPVPRQTMMSRTVVLAPPASY